MENINITAVKNHRDLYVVILQILSLAGGERLQSRQILMEHLLAHANLDISLGKNVISILLKGDQLSYEDLNNSPDDGFKPPTKDETGSDADAETDYEIVQAPTQKLLSMDALPKVLKLLQSLTDHSDILEFGLCQIHRLLLSQDERLPGLCISQSILSFLKGNFAICIIGVMTVLEFHSVADAIQ